MFGWMKKGLNVPYWALLVGLVAVSGFAASGTIHTWTGMGSRRNTVEMTLESSSLGTAAALRPGTDNANALGTSTYRWSDLQTVLATIGGTATLSGTTNISGATNLSGATTVTALLTASTTTLTGGFAPWSHPTPRASLTPTTTGQIVRNSTSGGFCYSTGTSAGAWVVLSATTTVCQN
jgi:hypothetical protein